MSRVIITDHANYRLLERNIDAHSVITIAKTGVIIKIESDGTMVKSGNDNKGSLLYVIVISKKGELIVKTAYYGN